MSSKLSPFLNLEYHEDKKKLTGQAF
uniref:Uncharacterized protein n=1 Tax=Anguilla anguilla TaxID=7936 RepID=A0A0E9VJY8_ANGAN